MAGTLHQWVTRWPQATWPECSRLCLSLTQSPLLHVINRSLSRSFSLSTLSCLSSLLHYPIKAKVFPKLCQELQDSNAISNSSLKHRFLNLILVPFRDSAFCSSFSAPTRLVPLSDWICVTWSLLHTNLHKALIQEAMSTEWNISLYGPTRSVCKNNSIFLLDFLFSTPTLLDKLTNKKK